LHGEIEHGVAQFEPFGKMKINDTLDDDEELTSIGSFPAWEAERVIKLLESAQIPFEIDVTDEQIRNQNVMHSMAALLEMERGLQFTFIRVL